MKSRPYQVTNNRKSHSRVGQSLVTGSNDLGSVMRVAAVVENGFHKFASGSGQPELPLKDPPSTC